MTFSRRTTGLARDFTIGGVIRETFRIAGLKFWPCFAVALAVVELPKWGGQVLLAPTLADFQRAAGAGDMSPIRAFAEGFALGAAPGLLAQIGIVLLTGIVVGIALPGAAGRAASFGTGLRAGLAAWPGNIVLTTIYYLVFLLAFALLIVPGLIVACMWAVYLPAHMAEGGSFTSCFGRSSRLTKGCRWRIAGLTLLYGLAVGFLLGFLSGLAKGLASAHVPPGIVISVQVVAALLGAAISVISASVVAALYFELRGAKEGLPRGEFLDAFS